LETITHALIGAALCSRTGLAGGRRGPSPRADGGQRLWDWTMPTALAFGLLPDMASIGLHLVFGLDNARITERMFFIISPDGQVIGTSTAWENKNYHGESIGQVHWVFILPEYHGRGLAKPLLTETMNRIKKLGHRSCYLGTQLTRIPAINLYLKFGFAPDIRTPEDRDLWRLLKPHINHPAIQCV